MKPLIVGIIPARYASTRLPGKPLIDIGGKTMIQRVYEQASKCAELSEVVVATDDEKIYSHVLSFGGKCVVTSIAHQSGTDRCAEAATNLEITPDAIINIQGDEPFISPDQIGLIAKSFALPETQIATLCKKIEHEQDVANPNWVKVVANTKGNAMYFSRSAIPYRRNQGVEITYMKHIGIYGYQFDVLKELANLQPSALELAESLEQLRWLEHGYQIRLIETTEEGLSIDTPDDLKRVEKYLIK
jgi:3-deoxy-manno-octulosonate cytidylyltransferase (CMP-KDO synthetase)